LSALRNTTAARIERATRRLDELRRERVEAERNYETACASLEALLADRAAQETPEHLTPSLPLRRSHVLKWACWYMLALALAVLWARHHAGQL
jgi:hypothetical protein